MERTPEEIKKGLECCYSPVETIMRCEQCPYYGSIVCKMRLHTDSLALIQQLQAENAEKDKSMQQLERSLSFACDLADGLKAATVKQEQELYVSEERNRQLETQNAELSGKIGQLQAERDAAVEALKNGDVCESCKHFGTLMDEEPCAWCGRLHSNFEWRGLQKEE